ncbi:hypothetical protein [Sphingobacterium bovistauri]|uniref:DoxX family protein n=1 Tax=Sphingobacterium bovistauri TaxID=2781959 RepID=A0ABS7Z4H5_9SPHI|nr:hypothetical protein [Sphingobacterium bovistauri]MCA5005047.1 hypothetical protein [Sphingobacterium bovistauri]
MSQIEVLENPIAKEEAIVETKRKWTATQKLAFRVFGTYFFLLCIPAYAAFYNHLFNLDFSKLTYHDFQSVVAFWPPQFVLIESEEGVFGFLNYINLIILIVVSIVIGLIWSLLDKKTENYTKLYYWFHVVVRYRLAFGMIGWGLKKAFPMQMVYPTIGMFNTPFIDMAEKKLYWSHVGVSFWYTVFLGFAEILPGLLLLNKRTASFGGALAAVVCFNIVLANHAFDAGVAVPAAYFTLLGIFILWKDIKKIYKVISTNESVQLDRYYPIYTVNWQKYLRVGVKYVSIFIFAPLAAAFWGYGFFYGNNYNLPSTQGLTNTAGLYQVVKFELNGQEIPYNPVDSIRWHDAIFENWSTLSYKTNRMALVDRMIGYSPLRVKGDNKNTRLNQVNTQDSDKLFKLKKNRDLGVTRWEVGGMAGNRSYFFYESDVINHKLVLQNKNKNHIDEKLNLTYHIKDDGHISLSGVNHRADSIAVELTKVNKKYPLAEGRRSKVQQF